MHKDDVTFFEEFKSLEQICSDMYSCQNGVTEYINQMDVSGSRGKSKVSGWESDYKMLKHVRWVRNQLAHESPEGRLSEARDVEFVKDFHSRLLNASDPLTLLRKQLNEEKKAHAKQHKQQPAEARNNTQQSNTEDSSKRNIAIGVSVCILIILIIILVGIAISKQ